jgi:hypothetical protein
MAFDGFADPNRNGADFNVLRDENGNEIPLQMLPPATTYGPCGTAWGKLTAVIDLPAMGEKTFAYGVTEKEYPAVGFRRQYDLLKKLSLDVFFDNSRTWGFTLVQFDAFLGSMEFIRSEEYCNGPVCSVLRAYYKYHNSEVWLDLYDYAGIPEIGVKVRLDWHEPKSCLKLSFDHQILEDPEFFTGSCGESVCRMSKDYYSWPLQEWTSGKKVKKYPASTEMTMIDWCAAYANGKTAAFFAPDLHSCDHADNKMRLTLVHPVLYADHLPFAQKEDDGWMDFGVHFRYLWIAEYSQIPLSSLQKYSSARLNNGEIREITAHPAGDLSARQKFCHLELPDDQVTVHELRLNDAGETEVILQNSGEETEVVLPVIGKVKLPSYSMRTFSWKD